MPYRDPDAAKAYYQQYREAHRLDARAYATAYRVDHREALRKEARERRQHRTEAQREHYRTYRNRKYTPDDRYFQNVKRTYGLTKEQYQTILTAQDNQCAICARRFASRAAIHIDHCHSSGKVRGLLCMGCNHGIGKFEEQPERLRAAIAYLLHHHPPDRA